MFFAWVDFLSIVLNQASSSMSFANELLLRKRVVMRTVDFQLPSLLLFIHYAIIIGERVFRRLWASTLGHAVAAIVAKIGGSCV